MTFFKYASIAMVFSMIGALPPGLINLTVAQRTISRGIKSGVGVAMGALVVEWIYTFLVIYFIDFFVANKEVGKLIKIIAVGIFLGMAVYYFLAKPKPIKAVSIRKNSRDVIIGIGVTAINLLIIPYWIFLGIWFRSNGYPFENISSTFAMASGSAFGAFFIFLIYIKLGSYIVKHQDTFTHYTYKTLSVIFLVLAVIQVFRMCLK